MPRKHPIAALAALTLVAPMALAQSGAGLPAKPMVIVVANAAGGPGDFIGRVLAPKLGEAVRQNVVVDNKPSANGVVAGELAARAVADGSVIAVGNTGTHAINATLYRKPTYDPVRDFAPIIRLVSGGLVLVANPQVPADNLRDLIAHVRRTPGTRFNFAIAGATGEIATNALRMAAKIDVTNVPYKGGAPAVVALMSGESQLLLTNYSGVAPQVEAGKLKLLATTSARREAVLPKLPTFAESGLDGYEVEMWYGLFAPAKTPAPVVQALNREVLRIMAMPEVRDRFVTAGYEIVTGTPGEFAERVKRDVEHFRRIILDSGMEQL